MGRKGPKGIFKDISIPTSTKAYRILFSKSTGGFLGSAAAIQWLAPRIQSGRVTLPFSLPKGVLEKSWQVTLGSAAVGFGVGYGVARGLNWTRMRVIKSLLTYNGWIFNQKSKTTMVWGLLLKLLVGPGPHGLHDFENVMPSLPVPDLDETCRKFLVNVKPLLTPEEYDRTKDLIEDLQKNEGSKLQDYIIEKSKKTKNWLADWWLTSNYLSNREPVALNVNFYMMGAVFPEVSSDSLARNANIIHDTIDYYEMIQKGSLPPDMVLDMIPTCMDGVRFMLASTRIPGEHTDVLEVNPKSKHVVIMCNGGYYVLDIYPKDDKGHRRRLNKHELKKQLQIVWNHARDNKNLEPVAVLTAQNRTKWAKDRIRLMEDNAETLRTVESAIFLVNMSEEKPETITNMAQISLIGNGANRWFDKSLVLEAWRDCAQGSGNMEHSGTDATHFAVMWEHVLQLEEYGPDGDLLRLQHGKIDIVRQDLPPPTPLHWNLDTEMKQTVHQAQNEFEKRAAEMDLIIVQSEFGRVWMKSRKVSPDGFIQMAIQLAFWRLHGCVTKTYEPASHRLFALGRTDNINPVSEESKAFVNIMENTSASPDDKIKALKAAISFQNRLRLEVTAGFGCDRHMLGLLCAAREMGMDIPAVFNDKAFNLPMRLSTSQVPTTLGHIELDLIPESINGGFGPACEDGYGVLYCSVGDNMFNFSISSWKSSPETDSRRFGNAMKQAMRELRELLDGKQNSVKSKQASGSNL